MNRKNEVFKWLCWFGILVMTFTLGVTVAKPTLASQGHKIGLAVEMSMVAASSIQLKQPVQATIAVIEICAFMVWLILY